MFLDTQLPDGIAGENPALLLQGQRSKTKLRSIMESIHEFMVSKTVTFDELERKFRVVGRQENGRVGVCPLCRSKENTTRIRSEAWTIMEYCHACPAITVRFPPDLMSGCENKTESLTFQEK